MLAQYIDGSNGNVPGKATEREKFRASVNTRPEPEFSSQEVFSLDRNKPKVATQETESEAAFKSILDPLAQEWPLLNERNDKPINPEETVFTLDQMMKFADFVSEKAKHNVRAGMQVNANPDLLSQYNENQAEPQHKEREQVRGVSQDQNHDLYHVDSRVVAQHQFFDAIRLPKTSLMKFNGIPMQFWIFMNGFNSCVHNSNVSSGDKLNRLFEYCTGKAAKVIQPCALMSPSEGYKKAR